MFLLVPAHPGFPGQIPQSCKTVVCVCVSLTMLTTGILFSGTLEENSPKRRLRSSPDLDPDLGWPWTSYLR